LYKSQHINVEKPMMLIKSWHHKHSFLSRLVPEYLHTNSIPSPSQFWYHPCKS